MNWLKLSQRKIQCIISFYFDLLLNMIKQPWNRFGENTSIAPSKSSKTIKSKFIVNTEKEPEFLQIYFKADPIREQIILRTKKQVNKICPQPVKQDRFGKISKIVSDLHKKRDQAKKRLQNLKQQADDQQRKNHPFTPEKKKIPKYIVTGDVIRRNEVWMQQKTKKNLYLKEERTLEELKQCTFSPTFEAKKQSEAYLKNKTAKSFTPQKQPQFYNSGIQTSKFYSPSKSRRSDITNRQYQTAKKCLVSKIMNTRII